MKKLIKLDFNNTTRERKTEDSYSELYSYDKNNGSFEFEILNDTLTTEQVIALFKFKESNKIWKTTGTVEGNKVKVTFDTTLITQNETVICYLYFDEEQRTSDTFRFKFKVKVSEIDKMNRYEVKERLTALENRPSTGGGTQDTGWIIISDDNPLHGNVVKIRRINDMVHVSLSNPNSEGLQLQFDDTVFRVILANKEIGKGFTPLNKLAIPVTEIESVMQTTTAETDVIGQVIFKVENGKAMMNGFGYKFSTSEPKEVHVNDFSYFTEDPFPTNLH